MKCLVTYFEPFGNDRQNSSMITARLLPPRIRDIEVVGCRVPVSFAKCADTVLDKMRQESPDLVICLGQAGGRAAVCPERVARNIIRTANPDNDGSVPENGAITAGAPESYLTSLPVDSLAECVRACGIPCQVSESAGSYVCNTLYFKLLHQTTETPVLFVHLPLTPAQADMRPRKTASLSPEAMAEAVSIIIEKSLAEG